MRFLTWLLSLTAAACAIGWLLGAHNCDVACFAAIGLAFLIAPGNEA